MLTCCFWHQNIVVKMTMDLFLAYNLQHPMQYKPDLIEKRILKVGCAGMR
jgi:hypothetical protein